MVTPDASQRADRPAGPSRGPTSSDTATADARSDAADRSIPRTAHRPWPDGACGLDVRQMESWSGAKLRPDANSSPAQIPLELADEDRPSNLAGRPAAICARAGVRPDAPGRPELPDRARSGVGH